MTPTLGSAFCLSNKSNTLPLATRYNIKCVGLSPDGRLAIIVDEGDAFSPEMTVVQGGDWWHWLGGGYGRQGDKRPTPNPAGSAPLLLPCLEPWCVGVGVGGRAWAPPWLCALGLKRERGCVWWVGGGAFQSCAAAVGGEPACS